MSDRVLFRLVLSLNRYLCDYQAMLDTLKLLLPALCPSWRFFDEIAPSPRIEFALLKTSQDTPAEWHELRPRPVKLSLMRMIKRLFWNPDWNDSLFLVSCAEQLTNHPTEHSHQEILKRIHAHLVQNSLKHPIAPYLQFRLAFVSRQGTELRKDITFISPVHAAGSTETTS